MYSEALAIADKNTVKLMIDEMKEQVTNLTAEVAEKDATIEKNEIALKEKDSTIAQKEIALKEKDAEIESLRNQLQALETPNN